MTEEIAKERALSLIRGLYNTKGLKAAVSRGREMIANIQDSSSRDTSALNNYKGEVAECLLQCYLQDLIGKFGPSLVVHGLCFRPEQSRTTTELDVTLFTSHQIYLFECKCFKGEKILRDKGTLIGRYTTADVFKQSAMHVELLNRVIGKYHLANNEDLPPYKLVLFDGSPEKCQDARSPQNRRWLEYINLDTIQDWIAEEFFKALSRPTQWNIPELAPMIVEMKRASGEMMKEHLARLGKRDADGS